MGAGKEDLWEKRFQERVLYNLEHILVDCSVFELKIDFFPVKSSGREAEASFTVGSNVDGATHRPSRSAGVVFLICWSREGSG